MSTKLKIRVTRNEIMKGECTEPTKCAIALAVRDIFPEAIVVPSNIHIGRHDIIWLPVIAQDFIRRFDRVGKGDRSQIPEIEFEVEIPDEIVNQINIEELRPLLINHPTLELV